MAKTFHGGLGLNLVV